MKNLQALLEIVGASVRNRIVALSMVSLLGSALESMGLGAVFFLFKAVSDPAELQRLPMGSWLSREAAEAPQRFFTALAIFLVSIVVVRAVVQLLQTWLSLRLKSATQLWLSGELFSGYVARPYSFHVRTFGGEIFTQLWQNVSQVTQNFVLGVSDLVSNSLLFVSITACLFWLQPQLTLTVATALGGVTFVFWYASRSAMRRWGNDWTETSKELMRAVQEPFTGIKTVKLSGREGYFRARFIAVGIDYVNAAQKYQFAYQASRPLAETLIVSGMIGAAMWAVYEGHRTADLLAAIAVFGLGAYRLLPAAIRIIGTLQGMQFTRTAFYQLQKDLQDIRTKAPDLATLSGLRLAPLNFERELCLQNVGYRYEGSESAAIDDVSLEIRRGQAIAFVGESGTGKTTLADILLGLLQPTVGHILLDGKPVASDSSSYRQLFAYVPQEAFIIDDTVRRNVAFGRPDAEIDDEQIHASLRAAELLDVVSRLPQGLDTRLGERGLRLSGGERQRLSLARALYDNPRILVLDEATSALDANTEDRVAKAVAALHGDITVVFIAHRLSTVQHCDRLFLLERGRISAAGTFAELMSANEAFRSTVQKMVLTSV